MIREKRCLSIILAAMLMLFSGCTQAPKSKSFPLPMAEKKEEHTQQEESHVGDEFTPTRIYKNYIEQYAVNGERVCGFLDEENALFFMKTTDEADEAVFYKMDYRYGFHEEYARVHLEPDNLLRQQETVLNDRLFYDVSADGRYFAYVYIEEDTWYIRLVDLHSQSEKTITSRKDMQYELGLNESAYEMHCRFSEDSSTLIYWWNMSLTTQYTIKEEMTWLFHELRTVYESQAEVEERLHTLYGYNFIEIGGYNLETEESQVWFTGDGVMTDVYRSSNTFNVMLSASGDQIFFWLYDILDESNTSNDAGDEAFPENGDEVYGGETDYTLWLFAIDTASDDAVSYSIRSIPDQIFYMKDYTAIQYHYKGLLVGAPEQMFYELDSDEGIAPYTTHKADIDYAFYYPAHDVFFGVRDHNSGSDLVLLENENGLPLQNENTIYKSSEYIHRIEMNRQGDKLLLFTSSSPRNNLRGSAAMQVIVIEF